MNKAIYIATSEENSGKSVITLGLMSMLMGKTSKVGYFRPIVEDFEEGKLDLNALYEIAKENGELTLQSGKQELFENIINQYI